MSNQITEAQLITPPHPYSPAKQRIDWVDIAKFIGFSLLIVIHQNNLDGDVHRWMSGFRMPIFFFLAGLLHKDRPLAKQLGRLSKTIIIPYIIANLIIGGIELAICALQGGLTADYSLRMLESEFVTFHASGMNIMGIPTWFLIIIFIVNITFTGLQKFPRKIVFPLLFIFVTILSLTLPVNDNPLIINIRRWALVVPIYMFGMICKQYVRATYPVGASLAVMAAWLVAYFAAQHLWPSPSIPSIFYGDYGDNLWRYYAEAASGIMALCAFSALLSRLRWQSLNNFAQMICNGGIVILIIHLLLNNMVVSPAWKKAGEITGLGFQIQEQWEVWAVSGIIFVLCIYPVYWAVHHFPLLTGGRGAKKQKQVKSTPISNKEGE